VSGDAGPVGFIGLGNMGTPMAQALISKRFPVTGFDTEPAARARLSQAGGTAVTAVTAVPQAAATVILMLPDSAAVESVTGELARAGALGAGHLIIDMSSSEPQRTRRLAGVLAEHGAALVDAPVSGGVRRAETATLTIMAGGDSSDIDRAAPALAAMGTVTHVGPVGAGHALKALNNLLSATSLLVTAEAMVAGERFGLDPEVMLAVFNSATGRSWATQSKWPDFVLTGRYDSGFALGLMVKDMRIALDLIRGTGSPDDVGGSALAAWAQAAGALPPAADHTEIARWVRERARPGAAAGPGPTTSL
jgi:3-hydroxyisobutyrate dehydrogenase